MIKRYFLSIFLCYLFFLIPNSLQAQLDFNYNPLLITAKVKTIIRKFEKAEQVESRNMYASGKQSKIYPSFQKLRETASELELIELTNHPNPITRYYAFSSLQERDISIEILSDVVKRHLIDTAIVQTQFGCMRRHAMVGDYMVSHLRYSEEEIDSQELDSLLFWQKGSLITEKNTVLSKVDKNPVNYSRLREIVVQEKNPEALLPLLSYGVEKDQKLIKDFYKISPIHALEATKKYPIPELIENLKEFQFKDYDYPRDRNSLYALYDAILMYEEKIASQFLENIYKGDSALSSKYQHAHIVYRLTNNRFSPFLDSIKLHTSHILSDMNESYFDYIWKLDSIKSYQVFLNKITKERKRYIAQNLHNLIINKFEEIHQDSAIHIIHAAFESVNTGDLMTGLFQRANKYNHPYTDSIFIRRFKKDLGGYYNDSYLLMETVLELNDINIYKGVEEIVFDFFHNNSLSPYLGEMAIKLILACNRDRALTILLAELEKEKNDWELLGRSVFHLLKLEDKEVNKKVLEIYKQKPKRFSKSYFGQEYQRHLERKGLL